MPGITGFISARYFESSRDALNRMVSSMVHEPACVTGTHIEERLGVAVGWVCHEGSFSDCLPIWNETRDIGLIFVGENFADQNDLDRLRLKGHVFNGEDASYLVHLYEEVGQSFFQTLNGTFVGLLIDLRERKVFLFNDRFGLGRIYYHEGADGFYFASEAKAILKVLPALRRVDMQSLGELFVCGCVLQNRTLFPGISLLPVGSAWTFQAESATQKWNYFDRTSWDNCAPLSPDDYYQELKATFSRVLPRYFRNSPSIAMSLTGGLDSRMIMAWAQFPPSGLPCYSHRGPFRECADATIARRVAKVCRQPHRTVMVDEKFFVEFPTLAEQSVYITDGTMDVSGAAGLYVNRVARREIASVRMTGNYGGEVLRSVVMLKPGLQESTLFAPGFVKHLTNAFDVCNAERVQDRLPISFVAFKQVPWFHFARYALESSQLTIRSPFLDNDLVALAFRAPREPSVNFALAEKLIAEGNPALGAFPTDRGPLGRRGVLGKVREQFQEFTFKAEYAYDLGMPHWLSRLDRVLSPLRLERAFLGRHKYCHFRLWYRNQLSGYIKEVLLDRDSLNRPYLDGRAVGEMVSAHVTGRGNYVNEIQSLLTAELIHRQLIESEPETLVDPSRIPSAPATIEG